MISCSFDDLSYQVQATASSPTTTVLRYHYGLNRGGTTVYLTGFTVSTSVSSDSFSSTVSSGDEVFVEVFQDNGTATPPFISQTNTLTVYFVDPPEITITHTANSINDSEVYCSGDMTTITVALTRLQPGNNQ